jgi:phosphoserine aminotransferase
LQFAAVYLNLSCRGDPTDPVDYIITGTWSHKAMQEAKNLGANINIVCNTKTHSKAFTSIPSRDSWQLSSNAKYVYYCDNETVDGVQFHDIPNIDPSIPLVCDMSSSLLSKKIDVAKYGVIFAGAQKNIGPAGVTIVIIRNDLLYKTEGIPLALNYRIFSENNSLYNTPPTYTIYMVGLVLEYLKNQYPITSEASPIEQIESVNARKAFRLYRFLDSSDGFYVASVEKDCRSMMNVVFRICNSDGPDESMESDFVKQSIQHGLLELKGHRSVGGIRASIYNAINEENVQTLISFLQDFQKNYE